MHLLVHALALIFALMTLMGCGQFQSIPLGLEQASETARRCDQLGARALSVHSPLLRAVLKSTQAKPAWNIGLIQWSCALSSGDPAVVDLNGGVFFGASWERREELPQASWEGLQDSGCVLAKSVDFELRRRESQASLEGQSSAHPAKGAQAASQAAFGSDWWSAVDAGNPGDLRSLWRPLLSGRTEGLVPAVVAVLDTGVDLRHPGLRSSLAQRSDGGVLGMDIVNGGRSEPQDKEGHGTAVSGFIAGLSRDGSDLGLAAGLAKIMPVKVLGDDGGGRLSDVANGIRWAADNGAHIINLSLGAAIPGGLSSPEAVIVRDAILYAVERGALVVAAAGNGDSRGQGYDITKPGSYDSPGTEGSQRGVLAIAAIDLATGRLASFSNFGPASVEMAAPGAQRSGLWTTLVGGAWGSQFDDGSGAGPAVNGTSFAAPIVAGTAAVIQAAAMQILKPRQASGESSRTRLTASALEELTLKLTKRNPNLDGLVHESKELSLAGLGAALREIRKSKESNDDGGLELCHD
jgi:hypothetical protein